MGRIKITVCFLVLMCLSCLRFSAAQVPDARADFAGVARGYVEVPTHKGLFFYGTVNNQGPVELFFDTGSSSLITTALATRLGLKIGPPANLSAFGGDPLPAKMTLPAVVRIGGLTLSNVSFLVLDAGTEEAAVLGDQLLRQTVVTLNWTNATLTLSDPKLFHYTGVTAPAPLRSKGWYITVDGAIDGLPGSFGIDTGAHGSLSVFSPFVEKEHLVTRYHATLRGYGGRGYAGPSQALYTRVHKLTLGDTVINEPLTYLLTDAKGFGASTDTGNIGREILDQFTITFDLPHGALYLDKNKLFGQPDIFNGAGLVLDAGDNAVTVMTVLPGSPGATGGIVVGDDILTIDHVSALAQQDPHSDDPVGVTAFLQPPGTVLHLRVQHGKEERDVFVTLKRIL